MARDSGDSTGHGASNAPPGARGASWKLAEACFLAAALLLLALQTGRALFAVADHDAWWALPLALVTGLLAADVATGTVHWIGDRFFEESTPLLGPALIRPFREHHVAPERMLEHGLLELHGNSALPVGLFLGAVFLAAPPPTGALGASVAAGVAAFAAAALATNQFHLWAHAPSVPRPVRWLQRAGVVLSPERHSRHHRGGFDCSYCITCGAMNPLLDRLDLFGRIERGLRRTARSRA